ncbi:acetyltransferase [Streptomyces lavendulae subsp. lavendulae]|uniref:GNAT family N-acetyltransferase n=1 Tax=Streptomyces lavendulae TaxID=1914 RepID=UPI00249FDDF1|nr:GNAT family N-acetyltransferase [Streptomyces lavendulae]GLV83169.1 acetyltransferase [Streptomyces lavendulae subsp. lavendulae]
MTGEDPAGGLAAAVSATVRALRAVAHLDWSVPAAGLEWSCRETAVHLAGDLTGFAAQLAGRVTGSYLPLAVGAAPGTPPGALVDLVGASGLLLAAAVRAARPDDRAWHPAGSAGPGGFAAMGAAELLLHTHDVLHGLGVTHWRGEDPAAALVLDRLFPHVPRSGPDAPWETLLAATGRAAFPGLPRRRTWRWYGDPVVGTGVVLCEISPSLAGDLADGGTGGFTWTADGPPEGTRAAAALLLRDRDRGAHRPGWGPYAIVRARDRRAIGGIGFHAAPDAEGRAETGCELVPSARGCGHATEALRALACWAFAQPGAHELCATAEEADGPSRAVLLRAGFEHRGAGRYVLRAAGR